MSSFYFPPLPGRSGHFTDVAETAERRIGGAGEAGDSVARDLDGGKPVDRQREFESIAV